MNGKVKTFIAFFLTVAAVIAGFVLEYLDRPSVTWPDENTQIMLYGEAHGDKNYYDAELALWKKCYDSGCRDLFVELPYFSAEFLNLWMKEDSDEIFDAWFEEIQGTQSGNKQCSDFYHQIKKECPETVFHGTDVGHQYDTTGPRYLEYLAQQGLADSDSYRLAQECMKQGMEFKADDADGDGISEVREAYMTSNFKEAYEKIGGKIMGIYGSYHTEVNNPQRMAGRLYQTYGDTMTGVHLANYIVDEKDRPYRFGFCITGLVFLLMLYIPNIIWGIKPKPEGYEESAKRENKILLVMERIGEAAVTCLLVIFPAINPRVVKLTDGLYFKFKVIVWITAFVLMLLYECYWIRYFRSPKKLADFYSSFAGFPLAGASLPVIAVFLLGLYSGNLIIVGASIILGIGHIGIHYMHKKEIVDG